MFQISAMLNFEVNEELGVKSSVSIVPQELCGHTVGVAFSFAPTE